MLALMGAMPEEVSALERLLRVERTVARAGRTFLHGRIGDLPAVVVSSRWGKVAAASTATELVVAHGVSRVVFIGIAGSLRADLRPGDVVVAWRLFQHDLDASPFFAPGVIPLLGVAGIESDSSLSGTLLEAARHAAGPEATVLHADIASGDRVVASADARRRVLERVPSAACVEMEGAAVAQVCFEHGVPFACVRLISDSADEAAEAAVGEFLAGRAASFAEALVRRWLAVNPA